jgi:predicted dehydrogenase
MAVTLQLPAGVLAQFDVALDLTRRDELELVGTEGRLVVPEPWLCRASHLELSRDGRVEHVPVDPEGTLGLTDPDHDVYRVELDTVSAAIAGGREPSFDRCDAIAQATVIEAFYRSAELGTPVAVGSAG